MRNELNTSSTTRISGASLPGDLMAGLVVFLIALPLCLGVALASNAPLISGIVSGIVGGIVVGLLSGSHTSVSGPANALIAVIAVQIVALGSFQAFLMALVIAGLIQIAMGLARLGFLAAFVPLSVIYGLWAAVGLIVVVKQIPHLFGYHPVPLGDVTFHHSERINTLYKLVRTFSEIHPGSAVLGLGSLAILIFWERSRWLRHSLVPGPLVVVVLGVLASSLLSRIGGNWTITPDHLVQVPTAESLAGLFGQLQRPDFAALWNPDIYMAGLTIAAIASLASLLNLEIVDRLDRRHRDSPRSRELFAQGVGNVISGLLGGLPVTSVIVRSSVSVSAGGQTKLVTITHGVLLLASVALFPAWINRIPLPCIAAILCVAGAHLVNFQMIRTIWDAGRSQFVPFVLTIAAIVLTDFVTGILIGLAASVAFILRSNMRRPLRRIVEKHIGGEVTRIELANQVSFLNRATLEQVLHTIPRGGHVLLDARNTIYIDPDVLEQIREFKEVTAPARGVEVSLVGFLNKYQLEDQTQFVDYSTRELQNSMTPEQVLQILKDGNQRFLSGNRLTRDVGRVVQSAAQGQHPLAVVVSCIDSRTPAELIFDLGMGDVFSARVAGNILTDEIMGSVEYGCKVAGAKLVLIMGHTRCGAVGAAVSLFRSETPPSEATGCQHIDPILHDIQESIDPARDGAVTELEGDEKTAYADEVARRNVARMVELLPRQSRTISELLEQGKIMIVGAVYDVTSGEISYLPAASAAEAAV